jgi:CAAX prenyl protease-like protein
MLDETEPSAWPDWSWSPVAIGAVVFALWMALEVTTTSQAAGFDPRRELPGAWATAWLVARVIGSVLIVPLAEELAFRGYLLRRLVSADFTDVSPRLAGLMPLAVSSLAFGALHGRWLAGTLAGVCYGLAYRHRGKLGDAVLSHATTNALIAAYVLTSESWSLWS